MLEINRKERFAKLFLREFWGLPDSEMLKIELRKKIIKSIINDILMIVGNASDSNF